MKNKPESQCAIYKSTATEECRFHSNTLGFTVYRLKPWNVITDPVTIMCIAYHYCSRAICFVLFASCFHEKAAKQ